MDKKCNICKRSKKEHLFCLSAAEKDGLSKRCRHCQNQYRAKNAEQARENWRRWRDKNANSERLRHRVDYENNLEHRRERARLNGQKNKSRLREYYLQHKAKNKEKIALSAKLYRIKNATKLAKIAEERRRKRKTNLDLRQVDLVTAAVRRSLSKYSIKVSGSSESVLKCTIRQFCDHVESQFREGMSWDNYGATWFLGKIVPFDQALNEKELVKLSHYSNFFPVLYSDRAALAKEGALEADQYCQALLGRELVTNPRSSLKKLKKSKKLRAADYISHSTPSITKIIKRGRSDGRL